MLPIANRLFRSEEGVKQEVADVNKVAQIATDTLESRIHCPNELLQQIYTRRD
jgi:hypothetical protein